MCQLSSPPGVVGRPSSAGEVSSCGGGPLRIPTGPCSTSARRSALAGERSRVRGGDVTPKRGADVAALTSGAAARRSVSIPLVINSIAACGLRDES
ncbi:Protein of unknown function [Gryllus bimaculatus]|nr:Protein of unknown function [Gryllus bimaculatus]